MGVEKKIESFRDLIVWKKAHELELRLYRSTTKFPRTEMFGIIDQLRRASVSISANIAEGMGRGTYPDRIRFYYNARGSTYEVDTLLITSHDLKYLSDLDYNELSHLVEEVGRLLNAFIRKTRWLSRNQRSEIGN